MCAINVVAFLHNSKLNEYVASVHTHIRAHAGDSQRFLEDGLAGKLSFYRHGY